MTHPQPRKLWQYKRPHGREVNGIAAIVRDRMIARETSPYAVAKACGINNASIYRFITGDGGLGIEALEAVLDHLELKIT